MNNKPLARSADIIVQESGDETLVYDLMINKALCLNETSRLVWDNCDGNNTVKDIAQILEKRLGEKVDENLVLLAVKQLSDDNLVTNHEHLQESFKGVSRREVIRKIAFTSAIAIPIIASITAPQAVDAASGSPGCTAGACDMSGSCGGVPLSPGNECCAVFGVCFTSTSCSSVGIGATVCFTA